MGEYVGGKIEVTEEAASKLLEVMGKPEHDGKVLRLVLAGMG